MNAKPGSTNRASSFRPHDDDYSTPVCAIVPFLRQYQLTSTVWEPACGTGVMAEVLKEHGYNVVGTNLYDRGYGEIGVDFLTTKELRAPTIITNPPFGVIDDFIFHALSLKPDILAIFARTKFLEGARRYASIHQKHPFTVMYQFIERIKFFASDTPAAEQPGWNTEAFAWFVWDQKGRHFGRRTPAIKWLSRQDAPLFAEVGT